MIYHNTELSHTLPALALFTMAIWARGKKNSFA